MVLLSFNLSSTMTVWKHPFPGLKGETGGTHFKEFRYWITRSCYWLDAAARLLGWSKKPLRHALNAQREGMVAPLLLRQLDFKPHRRLLELEAVSAMQKIDGMYAATRERANQELA